MKTQIKIFIFFVIVVVIGTAGTYHYRFSDLVLIKKAKNHIKDNNKAKAFELLDKASKISTRKSSLKQIIEVNLNHQRYEKLIPLLKKSLQLHPSAEYLHYIAHAYKQNRNMEGALSYLETADLPKLLDSIKNDYLIAFNIELQNYEEAEKILKEKIEICIKSNLLCEYFNKQNPYYELMMEHANLYSLRKQPEEAKIILKKLHTEFPENVEIKQRYIEALMWSGSKEEILLVLGSINDQKQYKKVLLSVVDINLEKGSLSEAENLLKEYLRKEPDQIDLRLKLAEVLAWQSRLRESANEYELILENLPENKNIRRSYAEVLSWMGEHKKAAEEIKKTLSGGQND